MNNPDSGSKWSTIVGWGLLVIGLVLYVVPLFYELLGFYSGLFAFLLIFAGISLLKYRKDQIK